jgi:hypothetical protein
VETVALNSRSRDPVEVDGVPPQCSRDRWIEPPHSQSKERMLWAPVAHACNPSNSGGRDQEGCNLKPAQANSLLDPNLKIPISQKRAGRVALGIGPELKSQYHKKKKKEKKKTVFFMGCIPHLFIL